MRLQENAGKSFGNHKNSKKGIVQKQSRDAEKHPYTLFYGNVKMAKNSNDEKHYGEEEREKAEEDEDIYNKEDVEKELEEDELSPREAAFMEGYDRDVEKTSGKTDESGNDEESKKPKAAEKKKKR